MGTVEGVVTSTALEIGVFLVSILQADEWAKFLLWLDTIFQYVLLLQIGIRIHFSMLSWVLMSSHFVGKCQTLTYIKSCRHVGLFGHSSPRYLSNSSLTVCAVLTLDSWNYFSGQQGPTAQYLPFNVFIEQEEMEISMCHLVRGI